MAINQLSEMSVELIDVMGSDYSVAHAAWISGGPERLNDPRLDEPGRVRGLLNALMDGRHGTPFEHTAVTFRVHAPIMVFREWHRHRVQSYNEQSGRYTVFKPDFYVPGRDRPLINLGTSMHPNYAQADDETYWTGVERLCRSYEESWDAYQFLLKLGWGNEMARLPIPVAMYSSMYATANLRAWMHFLGLRTSEPNAVKQGHPQWEIVQAAKQVEAHLFTLFPVSMELWDKKGRVAP